MFEYVAIKTFDAITRVLGDFRFQAHFLIITEGPQIIIGPILLQISYESPAHARSYVLRKTIPLPISKLWRDPSG